MALHLVSEEWFITTGERPREQFEGSSSIQRHMTTLPARADIEESKMSKTRKRSIRRGHERGIAAATVATGLALIATAVLTGTAGASSTTITITVAQNKTWGPTLTLKDGVTLYRLTKDSTDKSTCTGKCATVWVPVVLGAGEKKPVAVGVSHLGSFTRSAGVRQVTYEGIPLYTFTGDKRSGQVTGNIKNTWGQWNSINPSSPLTPPKKKGSSPTTTTTSGGGIAY
jgi:predicted lipoprotein with Yx(FWY)xxD motif